MASNAGTSRLEVAKFPVHQLTFTDRTVYRDRTLSIDRAEFLEHIAEPQVMAHIEVGLAHPGESCRIVHVLDEEVAWRRAFVERVIQILGTPVEHPTVFDVDATLVAG